MACDHQTIPEVFNGIQVWGLGCSWQGSDLVVLHSHLHWPGCVEWSICLLGKTQELENCQSRRNQVLQIILKWSLHFIYIYAQIYIYMPKYVALTWCQWGCDASLPETNWKPRGSGFSCGKLSIAWCPKWPGKIMPDNRKLNTTTNNKLDLSSTFHAKECSSKCF